jgi:hypothetical protein
MIPVVVTKGWRGRRSIECSIREAIGSGDELQTLLELLVRQKLIPPFWQSLLNLALQSFPKLHPCLLAAIDGQALCLQKWQRFFTSPMAAERTTDDPAEELGEYRAAGKAGRRGEPRRG